MTTHKTHWDIVKLRIWYTFDLERKPQQYFSSVEAAIEDVEACGMQVLRRPDVDKNVTGWAHRDDGFFAPEDIFIGWIDITK